MTAPTITVDDVCWTLSPAGQALLSADNLRLNVHIAAERASIVKHGGHRTVYHVALPNGVVYWKHCRLNGSRAWWRDAFRGPKARMEYDRLRALADRGIATIEPLAWGRFESRWPKGSFLITRAIEGTTPLDTYLEMAALPPFQRRRLFTQALAEFVRKLHDAGVAHPDFHPGNILVRDDGDRWQFYLIDVHDVRLGPPLSRDARLANLTLLNRWFRLRVARSDRLRFWRAYSGPDWSREDALELEKRTDRSVMELWASRDSRCLRENRHFRRVRGPGGSGFASRDLDASFEEMLSVNPDAPFERADVVLAKDSRSATVCFLEVPTRTGPLPMVYKRFRVTHWTDALANSLRSSPALRSWKNGHAFSDRALRSPLPMLVLHRRRFGLSTTGYLLCRRVQDAQHLHEAVAASERISRRQLIDQVARWIRLMHERGIRHRDLKAANILVTRLMECWFIDLVGVRIHRRVSRSLRVRDLARLNASFISSPHLTRSDRLRFLRTYLIWSLRGQAGWKEWWKEIAQATQVKIDRNRRRNRPLA
jgi:tRNA A-37 threonylcarbamoyl transferase component Bud32